MERRGTRVARREGDNILAVPRRPSRVTTDDPDPDIRLSFIAYDREAPVVALERRSNKGLFGTAAGVLKATTGREHMQKPSDAAALEAYERARRLAKDQARAYGKISRQVKVSPNPVRVPSIHLGADSDADSDNDAFASGPQSPRLTSDQPHPPPPSPPTRGNSNPLLNVEDTHRARSSSLAHQPLTPPAPPRRTSLGSTSATTSPHMSPNTRRRLQVHLDELSPQVRSGDRLLAPRSPKDRVRADGILHSAASADNLADLVVTSAVLDETSDEAAQAGAQRFAAGDLPLVQFFPLWLCPFELPSKQEKKRQQLIDSLHHQCHNLHRATQRIVGKTEAVIKKDMAAFEKTETAAMQRSVKAETKAVLQNVTDSTQRKLLKNQIQERATDRLRVHLKQRQQMHQRRLLDLLATRVHLMHEVQLQQLKSLREFDTNAFQDARQSTGKAVDKTLKEATKTFTKTSQEARAAKGAAKEQLRQELVIEATDHKVVVARTLDAQESTLRESYQQLAHAMDRFYDLQLADIASIARAAVPQHSSA